MLTSFLRSTRVVLPLQTFPLILDHTEPLLALEHLSQNFPLYSSAFGQMEFKSDTPSGLPKGEEDRYRELWRNRQIWSSLRAGRGMTWQGMRGDGKEGRVWIGAKEVQDTEMDLFQCVSPSSSSAEGQFPRHADICPHFCQTAAAASCCSERDDHSHLCRTDVG